MPAIEVVRFRLREGVSIEEARAAVTESSKFLDDRAGFKHRITGCTKSGDWIDIVTWASMTEALEAAEAFMHAPEAEALIGAIDMATAAMEHYSLADASGE